MASPDKSQELDTLLVEAAKAIHEAFERGEQPSKDARVRTLLDRVNELRQRSDR